MDKEYLRDYLDTRRMGWSYEDRYRVERKDGHRFIAFIGDDWKGTPVWDKIEAELKTVGCKTIYIPYTSGISTTEIRQKLGEKINKTEEK